MRGWAANAVRPRKHQGTAAGTAEHVSAPSQPLPPGSPAHWKDGALFGGGVEPLHQPRLAARRGVAMENALCDGAVQLARGRVDGRSGLLASRFQRTKSPLHRGSGARPDAPIHEAAAFLNFRCLYRWHNAPTRRVPAFCAIIAYDRSIWLVRARAGTWPPREPTHNRVPVGSRLAGMTLTQERGGAPRLVMDSRLRGQGGKLCKGSA